MGEFGRMRKWNLSAGCQLKLAVTPTLKKKAIAGEWFGINLATLLRAMRSGPSSDNKLMAKVQYNSVEQLESRWVNGRHYIKAKFTGWVTRKNGGITYVMDKQY